MFWLPCQKIGKKNSGEAEYLARAPTFVISTPNWICCCKDTRSGVEHRRNTSLRYRNGLLFHSFMNGNPIFVAHFVEFVYTDNPSICKNHGTTLEIELAL
jgi:hypothetical protein